jgi:hypothetical protein
LKRFGFGVFSVNKYPSLRPGPKIIVKEIIKAVLPWRKSAIRQYVRWRRYSQADMFIRARLGS